MSATSSNNDQHVYRLALYGVRSSGKTCILSALSLPRVAHPNGISCTWISDVPGHPLPKGDPKTWTTNDPFHRGWLWLNEQRERLKHGKLPKANPYQEDAMRFLFDFGSREHGTRHVELIDYSGELITASASELAEKLREHMQACDGLLILAEVPYADRDHTPLANDLQNLKEAFLQLLGQKDSGPMQEWPIALLFNKWDRRKNFDDPLIIPNDMIKAFPDQSPSLIVKHIEPTAADDVIKDFLNQSPEPPHKSLVDTIVNAVGDGNVHCFPVSAFGAHRVDEDGAEVPRLDGPLLKSHGLEDGFIWAADRSNALRVTRLEDAARAASWWAFPQMFLGSSGERLATEKSVWTRWFCGVSPASGVSASWKLMGRFPKARDFRRHSFRALRTFGLKLVSQLAVLVVAVLALLIGIETTLDGISHRQILATQKNPSAMPESLQRGEAWLEQYFVSPSYRHWLSCQVMLDRAEAHRLLVESRTRRDKSLWQTAAEAETPESKIILARRYLEAMPSGLHRSDADSLVTDADRKKKQRIADADRVEKQRKNEEHLDQRALKIDAIPATATAKLDELHSLSENVGNIPYPEAHSNSIAERQQQLRKVIAQKQTQIADQARQAEWEKFKQNYLAQMRNKNVIEAARLLKERNPKDGLLKDLEKSFAEQAPSIIQGKVQDALKNRSWRLARESRSLGEDSNVAGLLSALAIKDIQKLEGVINEAEDRDLYDKVVKYKPQCIEQIDAYLTIAPLKSMKLEVENYKKYVNAMKSPLKLTLNLTTLKWHNMYYSRIYNYSNNVTVEAKGEPLIMANNIWSKPNTASAAVGAGDLEVGLNETITIDVSIVARYGTVSTSTMSGGSGTWTGTANQLRSGVTIDLNGNRFTNMATFSLSGIPVEPLLPAWKK